MKTKDEGSEKSPLAIALIERMKKKGGDETEADDKAEDDSEAEEPSASEEAQLSAMEDFQRARGNPEAGLAAFKRLIEACGYGE